ncbi:MAG: nucleoside triphosphate pyrophosphohydrolase, partial [Gammaproteobacteria bacterium]|nr:nucleoside triphosphate pyrophosphohydrolase [Gammaproteobacteria bacterium]
MDLQIAAKSIGLDWLEVDGIISKIREETEEVDEAIKNHDN